MTKTDYIRRRCELAEWLTNFIRGTVDMKTEHEYIDKFKMWQELVNTPEPSDWIPAGVENTLPEPLLIALQISAGIYLKFHEKLNLTLENCDEITDFILEYLPESPQTTKKEE